jgi:hypothetical protein
MSMEMSITKLYRHRECKLCLPHPAGYLGPMSTRGLLRFVRLAYGQRLWWKIRTVVEGMCRKFLLRELIDGLPTMLGLLRVNGALILLHSVCKNHIRVAAVCRFMTMLADKATMWKKRSCRERGLCEFRVCGHRL